MPRHLSPHNSLRDLTVRPDKYQNVFLRTLRRDSETRPFFLPPSPLPGSTPLSTFPPRVKPVASGGWGTWGQLPAGAARPPSPGLQRPRLAATELGQIASASPRAAARARRASGQGARPPAPPRPGPAPRAGGRGWRSRGAGKGGELRCRTGARGSAGRSQKTHTIKAAAAPGWRPERARRAFGEAGLTQRPERACGGPRPGLGSCAAERSRG